MRKIGATSAGSVIIEMTKAQFAALTQVMDPKSEKKEEQKKKVEAPVMAITRKLAYVRNCLDKLQPKTRTEVERTIRSMFHGTGGIRTQEIEQILQSLIKDKYLAITKDESVQYTGDTHNPKAVSTLSSLTQEFSI
jgi:hypothetical protein